MSMNVSAQPMDNYFASFVPYWFMLVRLGQYVHGRWKVLTRAMLATIIFTDAFLPT